MSARNPDAARNVRSEIERTATLLGQFPTIGTRLRAPGIRYHVTRRYRYRIVYRVTDEAVHILQVYHPSRNMPGR